MLTVMSLCIIVIFLQGLCAERSWKYIMNGVQTQTVVPVTRTVTTKMLQFINAEFTDIHFMNGFCDGNSLTALKEYQH
jgi:hypothetical protein